MQWLILLSAKGDSCCINRSSVTNVTCPNKDAMRIFLAYRSQYSDSLRPGRSGDRIPVGARFSASVPTDPAAHPASYTMGKGSFPGVKRPGREVGHPLPSSAEIIERIQLYLYSPSGSSWAVVRWTSPFTCHCKIHFNDGRNCNRKRRMVHDIGSRVNSQHGSWLPALFVTYT